MSDAQQPPPPKTPKRDPAFPLYADDFLSGTADMSADEVGAYIRLLCHQWAKGGLPNDEPRLARMAGLMGSPSLGYVMAKFSPCPDGCLRNDRLEAIRAERAAYKARQSDSGAEGAKKRWEHRRKDGDRNGKPMATPLAEGWPKDSFPSPSPSPEVLRGRENTRAPEVVIPDVGGGHTGPTAAEVLASCSMLAIPDDVGRAFWEHFEAQGWRTANNMPIVQWTAKLSAWYRKHQAQAAEAKAKAAANGYRIGTSTPADEAF